MKRLYVMFEKMLINPFVGATGPVAPTNAMTFDLRSFLIPRGLSPRFILCFFRYFPYNCLCGG